MDNPKVTLTPKDEVTVTINGVVVGTYSGPLVLEVKGDTKKLVDTNISLTITGNVAGDVDGTNITCGNVGGNVDGTNITCGDVGGDVDGMNISRR